MKHKQSDNYKVSWSIWREAFEILASIVLALGLIYLLYLFFYPRETANYDTEKTTTEKDSQASGGYRIKVDNIGPTEVSDFVISPT